MKNIILFFIIFSTYCFAQTYELKEIRTAKDSTGKILEMVVEIKEVETGSVFNLGLPKSEWLKTEDEQVQFVINKYKNFAALKIKVNQLLKREPTVTTKKSNKVYK